MKGYQKVMHQDVHGLDNNKHVSKWKYKYYIYEDS